MDDNLDFYTRWKYPSNAKTKKNKKKIVSNSCIAKKTLKIILQSRK